MPAMESELVLKELMSFRAEMRQEVAAAFQSLERSNERMMQEIQSLRALAHQQAGQGSGGTDNVRSWKSPVERSWAESTMSDEVDRFWYHAGPVAEGLRTEQKLSSQSTKLVSEFVIPAQHRVTFTKTPSDDGLDMPRGNKFQTVQDSVIPMLDDDDENGNQDLSSELVSASKQRLCSIKVLTRTIHPASGFRLRWDLFLLLLLLYVCITAPVIVAFDVALGPDNTMWWVETVVTVFFVLDILINFNTAYFGVHDQLVTNRLHIATNYAMSWLAIDVVAVIPFELLTGSSSSEPSALVKGLRLGKFTRLLRVLRVVKLLRILKVFKLSPVLKRLTAVSGENLLKIVSIAGSALLLLHLMACAFYMAAKLKHEDMMVIYVQENPDMSESSQTQLAWDATWIGSSGLSGETEVNKYIAAMYWSMYTLTTVGYGDIAPQNLYEKLVAMAAMLVGVTVFAYFMGNMASFISAVNSQEAAISKKIMQMKEFLRARHVPTSLSNKISTFYSMAARKQVLEDDQLLSGLSTQLRTELLMFLYRKTLDKVPFFQGQNPQFITSLVLRLKLEYYADGDMVVEEHDLGSEMYFVINGQLEARRYYDAPESGELNLLNNENPSNRSSEGKLSGLFSRVTSAMMSRTNTIKQKIMPVNASWNYVNDNSQKLKLLGGHYEIIGTLQEGEHFGETAIILGHPRASTVVAVEFSELYSLSRNDLIEVYQRWPELYRQFQEFVDQVELVPATSDFKSNLSETDGSRPSADMLASSEASSIAAKDEIEASHHSKAAKDTGYEIPGSVGGNPGDMEREESTSSLNQIMKPNEVRQTLRQGSVRSKSKAVIASLQREVELSKSRDHDANLNEDCEDISSGAPLSRGGSNCSSSGNAPMKKTGIAAQRLQKTAKMVMQMKEEGVQDNPVLRLLENGYDLKAMKQEATTSRR